MGVHEHADAVVRLVDLPTREVHGAEARGLQIGDHVLRVQDDLSEPNAVDLDVIGRATVRFANDLEEPLSLPARAVVQLERTIAGLTDAVQGRSPKATPGSAVQRAGTVNCWPFADTIGLSGAVYRLAEPRNRGQLAACCSTISGRNSRDATSQYPRRDR